MREELEKIDYFKWVDETSDKKKSKHSVAIIIGGTIGAICVLLILCFVIWRYTRKQADQQISGGYTNMENSNVA